MEQIGDRSNHTNDSLFISGTCMCIYYIITWY